MLSGVGEPIPLQSMLSSTSTTEEEDDGIDMLDSLELDEGLVEMFAAQFQETAIPEFEVEQRRRLHRARVQEVQAAFGAFDALQELDKQKKLKESTSFEALDDASNDEDSDKLGHCAPCPSPALPPSSLKCTATDGVLGCTLNQQQQQQTTSSKKQQDQEQQRQQEQKQQPLHQQQLHQLQQVQQQQQQLLQQEQHLQIVDNELPLERLASAHEITNSDHRILHYQPTSMAQEASRKASVVSISSSPGHSALTTSPDSTCSCSKLGRQLLSNVFNLPLNTLFDWLFSNDASPTRLNSILDPLLMFKSAHRNWGSSDLVIGSWLLVNEKPFKRKLTYKHVFNSLLVGNITTTYHEDQILMAQDNNHVLVKSRLTIPDVPYGTAFCIHVSYCLSRSSPVDSKFSDSTSKTQLQIFGRVEFSKSVMVSENITTNCMETISEFTKHILTEINLRTFNQGLRGLSRSNTRRPGGPRSEPASSLSSPLNYCKPSSPSPSAPSPIRKTSSISLIQPIKHQSPISTTPYLNKRISQLSVYSDIESSTTRVNQPSSVPIASTFLPAPADEDDSQTAYSKTGSGISSMSTNKFTQRHQSLSATTLGLDHVEMFEHQPPSPIQTSTQQQPITHCSHHPSKRKFITTAIQPISSFPTTPASTSATASAGVSPTFISYSPSRSTTAASSPLVVSPSNSPTSIYTSRAAAQTTYAMSPAIIDRMESGNSAETLVNGGGSGNSGTTKQLGVAGPRPFAPPRSVKFRQASAPTPLLPASAVDNHAPIAPVTITPNEHAFRSVSVQPIASTRPRAASDNAHAVGEKRVADGVQGSRVGMDSKRPAAAASDEFPVGIGAFELVAAGSVLATVSGKAVVAATDAENSKRKKEKALKAVLVGGSDDATPTPSSLLAEIAAFGRHSLPKRTTTTGKGATTSHVPSTEQDNNEPAPSSTTLEKAKAVVSETAAPPSAPAANAPKTVSKKYNKELPKKVGYKVRMPGHWVRERKSDAEFFADHTARRLWIDNLRRNSITGLVTLSLLSQLVFLGLVSASSGDLRVLAEWWGWTLEWILWGCGEGAKVGGKKLNEGFMWFGLWAAGQLGFVPKGTYL